MGRRERSRSRSTCPTAAPSRAWPKSSARDCRPVQGAAAEVLLRRARLGAVRADHRTARVLPDPLRARDPRRPSGRDRRRGDAADADRARLGRRLEEPRAARRDAGRRALEGSSRSTSPRGSPAASPPSSSTSTRGWRSRESSATTRPTSSGSHGRRAPCRVPRRHDRQLPAGAATLVPGPDRDADVSRGPVPARRRPRQGASPARGRLQRRGRSDSEFNKNVLNVLNRELDADFDLDAFEHVAFWDPDNEWIDIRLRALTEQFVDLRALDMRAHFSRNEEMRTEISTKFTRERIEASYADAGLELIEWWTDPDGSLRARARPPAVESALR